MRRIVGLVTILLFILLVSSSAVDQLTPFIAENYTPLDIDQLDLSIMKQDLEDCQVILSGAEIHGTTATYELQYALTTALHQQAEVRYLLLGIGHATAQMYNAYLESGDPKILSQILSEVRFSSSSSLEHRLVWENLHQFNQSLSEEDRLTVIGIDLEYQPYTAIYYLSSLAGQSLVPAPEEYLGTPDTLARYVSRLERHFSTQNDLYREALGDNYGEFELVLANLSDTVAANVGEDFYAIREETMYKNFLRAYDTYPQGKFFGQFTMEHVFQHQAGTSKLDGTDSLAMYLNRDDSPVQGQVISIAAMYRDSVFRFFYGRYYTADIQQDFYTEGHVFSHLSDTDYTLFRLIGEDSPFNRSAFTIRNPYGGVTTDYFQYLLIIKNSGSTSANKS